MLLPQPFPSPKRLWNWLPPRRKDSHKGRFGHLLIVAGSADMMGAAVLSARAALRSGAGLVTLAVPKSQKPAALKAVPEALIIGASETASGALAARAVSELLLLHKKRNFQAMAIGPGLGTGPQTAKAVVELLEKMRIPCVIDADALNVLSKMKPAAVAKLFSRRAAGVIFTPHPGELSRLLKKTTAQIQKDRVGSAVAAAMNFHGTCVLKGHRSVVADGERVCLNPTGNPGLAKGGSGDVLTGILGGLWVQRLARAMALAGGRSDAFETGVLGAYLHGLSADIAAVSKTHHGLLAGDVIENLPAAFKKLQLLKR